MTDIEKAIEQYKQKNRVWLIQDEIDNIMKVVIGTEDEAELVVQELVEEWCGEENFYANEITKD